MRTITAVMLMLLVISTASATSKPGMRMLLPDGGSFHAINWDKLRQSVGDAGLNAQEKELALYCITSAYQYKNASEESMAASPRLVRKWFAGGYQHMSLSVQGPGMAREDLVFSNAGLHKVERQYADSGAYSMLFTLGKVDIAIRTDAADYKNAYHLSIKFSPAGDLWEMKGRVPNPGYYPPHRFENYRYRTNGMALVSDDTMDSETYRAFREWFAKQGIVASTNGLAGPEATR